MSLLEIIRKRREELGLTQDDVARRVGITKPYLSNLETGKANPPRDDKLRKIEKVLNFQPGSLVYLAHRARTPPDILSEHEEMEREVERLRGLVRDLLEKAGAIGEEGIDMDSLVHLQEDGRAARSISSGVLIPIINKVTAGYPQVFTDLDYPVSVADEYIRCPDVRDSQAFAARVVGDSMEPTYVAGDIVVFSPNTPATPGRDCFVRFDADEGTTFKRVYQDDERTLRLQPLNDRYPPQVYHREHITGLWPAVFKVQRVGEE